MSKRSDKGDLKEPGVSDLGGNTGDSRSREITTKYDILGSAPKPKEAEVLVTADTVKVEAPPATTKPSIPLRVWIAMSGIKANRLAGFLRYAQLEEMRPCPASEWAERYQAFLNKPTK